MSHGFDVAIVGISCRVPGAHNDEEFWSNLAAGVESITRLSDEEILGAGVPANCLTNRSYVKAAPLLDEPEAFDAVFFGFSPTEARTLDPQHRILLELAHEALENAGYDPARYHGRIGVFAGSALNTYFTHFGLNRRLAEDYIPTLIGSDKDFLSTRISYKLNLKGPSITVQTACSTSLVAVHLARQSLLSEETDIALAGAVSVRVPHRVGYFCDNGGIVSPDGRVRAFDAGANGTVFGSGGGVLVLKRLADALSDGDTIRAVISGSAVNNDGSEKVGYTAPGVNGQADAVVEALANADVGADTVSYVEAHGSGTPVGDPVEIKALTKAFRTFTARSGFCAIGSVKTNVGHLDAAAGLAGIVKTVLALEHRQLPPSLHYREANPEIDFPSTPFWVNTQLRTWNSEGPRRACVMSTGMGGTNACVVLEQAPEPEDLSDTRASHLLVLSANTETALSRVTRRLREFLIRDDRVPIRDVAFTLQNGRKALRYRRHVVCGDREDAITGLEQVDCAKASEVEESARRPVVLLLPGIGDHYVGMAHGLYETWGAFREEVDRCAGILEPYLGADIRAVLYPSDGKWKPGSGQKGLDLRKMLAAPAADPIGLNTTLFAQPALFTIEYAMARLWQSLGIAPDAILGHSMGEYVAACLAGVLSLDDALRLIASRARLVDELPQGGMLAVALPESELLPILIDNLSIALINGPRLCVVAGPAPVVAEFEKVLDGKGVLCRRIQNAHAFHSRMLDPIVKPFMEEVARVQLNEPRIPYLSNVTGTWIAPREATNPAYWAKHANHTARFSDGLHELWQFKDPVLLEAGPGRTLSVLALQHPDRPARSHHLAISSLRHHYENMADEAVLWDGIGRLWSSGAEIRWDRAHTGASRRRVALPTYPFERQWYWPEPVRQEPVPLSTPAVKKIADPSQWLHTPSWKRVLPISVGTPAVPSSAGTDRVWLVYEDECGLASILVRRLRSEGHEVVTVRAGVEFQHVDSHVFVIEPGNAEHYEALIRALQAARQLPARIIHAWSITSGERIVSESERLTQALDRGFYSLLFLAQALGKHNIGSEIELSILSNNVQDVVGTEALCPEKAAVLGPCLVIRQEYPNVRTRSIDLELPGNPAERDPVAELVLGELLHPDTAVFVAHRNHLRWVQTYEPVALNRQPDERSPFRRGGVYLITGGLGRIGGGISEYLATTYAAKLLLVGRQSLPPRHSWKDIASRLEAEDPVGTRVRAIERIESLGAEVSYVSADVADAAAMRRAIEEAYRRFGTLHGVIHAAGLVRDDGYREIKDCDHDTCDRHFVAKAYGLRVLQEALEGRPLDFCMLVSSMTSLLGGIAEVAYASSNIYMDLFARAHNQSHRARWLSVNWDVFRFPEETVPELIVGKTLEELGHSMEEAAQVMESALTATQASQLVVSTGDLSSRISQWIGLESLRSRTGEEKPGPAVTEHGQRSGAQTNREAPPDDTEHRIAVIWQEALGIDHVGIHDSFARLGGHSLLAVRIVAELRKAFQVDLPIRVLFEAPTVAELSGHIKREILAAVERLTDEEAQRLVSNE